MTNVAGGRWPRARSNVAGIVGLLLIWASTAVGQAVEIDQGEAYREHLAEALAAGRHALDARNFDAAEEHFLGGLRSAHELGDEAGLLRSYFYLGLTNQERAGYEGSEVDAIRLERASDYYEQARRLAPRSAAVHNNLGRTYEALGDTRRARAMYATAVKLGGTDRDLYLSNYTALVAREGVEAEAAKLLRELAERRPEDAQTHRQLADYYVRTGSEELSSYLWSLLAEGHVVRVEETAARALIEADLSASARVELLTVLTAALSRQSYPPDTLPRPETFEILAHLVSDSELGSGARAILAVHDSPSSGDAATWWSGRGKIGSDPVRGMWPRDAFRELIRAIGGWYESRRQADVAEEYYRLAAGLVPEEVDPVAVRDLVRAHLRQGDLEGVERVVAEYEPRLFEGKGDAYRTRQLEKIYEFHRTLGEIYGQIGRWGDRGTVNSAIFQLENARLKAEELEQAAPVGDSTALSRDGELRFGPELADLLARAYAATGDTTASQRTRIDAATRYKAVGADAAAVRVVEPIQPNRLQDAQLRRYDALKLGLPLREEAPAAADTTRVLRPNFRPELRVAPRSDP